MMPNQTEAALARHWPILTALIAEIADLVERRHLPATMRHHLCHLIRLAEGLARRWLMLNAQVQTFRKNARAAATTGATGKTGQGKSARVPLLALAEPDPVLRAEHYSFHPFEPALPSAPRANMCPSAAQDSACSVAVIRRAQALRDVMQRPAFHTARMARWLRRAADKARTAFTRLHPLRVGRPPGARRRDRKGPIQAALWWLDQLARDSVEPAWVP